MKATVQRWGNSLAIRIPKAFAEQADIKEATEVDIAIQGNTIVISPAPKEWTLEELLKGITPSNKPKAVDWGSPVGKEVW